MYNRNQKYSKKNNTKDKISLNLDIIALQLFCNYVVSENKSIHRSNIINMRNLFDSLDMAPYSNDAEKMAKINFIKKGLEARLVYNLNKKNLILMHINGGILSDITIDDLDEVNNDEIIWLNKIVADGLNYGFMYSEVDRLDNLCQQFYSFAQHHIHSQLEISQLLLGG